MSPRKYTYKQSAWPGGRPSNMKALVMNEFDLVLWGSAITLADDIRKIVAHRRL